MQARRSWPALSGSHFLIAFLFVILLPLTAVAAPYAALVMDARTGQVLYARNADTRLYPASLTKMMTLYIAFQAIENGEISLDTKVRISKHAASEPPSKLGMRPGQRIALRYLIRAAAVKSANDAATAIGEAISGSEAAFARRMNRTAKSLGMTRTTFKNANGLTEDGHKSTVRDMTNLGRHLLYDYPQYYNLFSRRSTNAGGKTVNNTNRRLLNAYRGADGIKTGYTNASGFNLVASAQRGNVRIIATVFGGKSSSARNAKVAELLDLGFRRAPSRAPLRKPQKPVYMANADTSTNAAGQTTRLIGAVRKSLRPQARTVPGTVRTAAGIAATVARDQDKIQAGVNAAITQAQIVAATQTPAVRPAQEQLIQINAGPPEQEIVTRLSTSGDLSWGINVGIYPNSFEAEKMLLRTALEEMTTLDGAQRKVTRTSRGFKADFVGMSRETADLSCRRLKSRDIACRITGPS